MRILPFLEQQALFDEFKLDEPWDSPHNKALLERMPSVFAIPNAPAGPKKTVYRGISGKRTIFDPTVPKGVALASITDGTSNTIGVVEARKAVPWTEPDSEIPFDESLQAGAASSRSATLWAAIPTAGSTRPVLRRFGAVYQGLDRPDGAAGRSSPATAARSSRRDSF